MKIENIKFKAKRLDGKGWVCGYFYEENGNTSSKIARKKVC